MRSIVIVDTSFCTSNIGDQIIMEAVNEVVAALFPLAFVNRVTSHEALSTRQHDFILEADLCFLGGTNLLSSNLSSKGLWKVTRADAEVYALTPTVCLGTGWERASDQPSAFSSSFLKTSLTQSFSHAARDSFAETMLAGLGLPVLNTACPTMWRLTPEHCQTISTEKNSEVAFTLTAWLPDAEPDARLVRLLLDHYDRLYFFPQMSADLDYAKQIAWDQKIEVVPPNLKSYDAVLQDKALDYVGTRLHGGIRALNAGVRALILSVDHRAARIAEDTALPVVARGDDAAIAAWIKGSEAPSIALPREAIEAWKAQFAEGKLETLIQQAQAAKVGRKQRRPLVQRMKRRLRDAL